MQKIDLKTPNKKIIQLDQPGEYQFNLLVPEAEVVISSGLLAVGRQELFLRVIVNHLAPRTHSTVMLKAVGKNTSSIKFAGRIIIVENCFASTAFLTERILLLSKQARAEIIPDLEIKNHDVKCSHATSITQLNEKELFYLMSRGIGRLQAEKMIISGFFNTP